MKTTFVTLSTVVVCLALACGKAPESGGAEAPTPTAEPPAEAAPAATEPGAPDVPWANKTREQRKEYMGLVVLPKMKELFQGHDEKEFAEFKCTTCHGKDMEAVDFKMPNSLPSLPSDPAKFKAEMDEHPEVAKFMMEKVVPTMADLLGEKPVDPSTGQGFGCFECHPKE